MSPLYWEAPSEILRYHIYAYRINVMEIHLPLVAFELSLKANHKVVGPPPTNQLKGHDSDNLISDI